MIEPKLTFFKIQIKSGFGKSPELGQWHFSDPPEVFDSVDMGLAVGKFISAMLNPMVFPPAPRPLFPLTRRAPKKLSSTSTSPDKRRFDRTFFSNSFSDKEQLFVNRMTI